MTMLTVFGDPVMDYIYCLADPIRRGGKMLARAISAVPGGTTANMSCAAAKLGLEVTLVGRVARGDEARLHRAALEQAGVRADLTEIDAPRGTHCLLFLDPDGEKTLCYVPTQAPPLDQTHLGRLMKKTRYAYTMAADFQLLANQSDTGPVICVDVDAAAGLTMSDFSARRMGMDIIFINDVGFQKLTGTTPDAAGLEALMGPRAELIICTGGAGTTWLLDRRNGQRTVLSKPALPARVVDATGAGDAFNAAFLSRLIEGAPMEQALSFAMAAGALATETLGARAAAPTLAQIEARLRTIA